MKITVSVSRKIGQPNYGSAGASCELALDVAEMTVSESPVSLVDEIRRAYALAEQCVAEQLGQHQGGPVGPPPVIEPDPPRQPVRPDRSGLPSQGRAPSTPAPDRPPVNGNGRQWKLSPPCGLPHDARQLYAWLKRQDEEHDAWLLKYISKWLRLQEFPDRLVTWDDDQVAAAHAEATRKLSAVTTNWSSTISTSPASGPCP